MDDTLIWQTYTGRDKLYALSVSKSDDTTFTHEEVLEFLGQYTLSPAVLVTPMSDIQELQAAIDRNIVNGEPWDHDLPA